MSIDATFLKIWEIKSNNRKIMTKWDLLKVSKIESTFEHWKSIVNLPYQKTKGEKLHDHFRRYGKSKKIQPLFIIKTCSIKRIFFTLVNLIYKISIANIITWRNIIFSLRSGIRHRCSLLTLLLSMILEIVQ